jgi:hypothetical protein
MIDRLKNRRTHSVLGLSLDGARLDAVVLRRTNGSAQITATLEATVALDPMTADPELVGSDIRNRLDAAGIRERRCVVCLPLNWVMLVQANLPELAEADLASLLQLEAERGFPYSPDALVLVQSRCSLPSGRVATQLAVSREHIARLERVLRAARLVPVRFSLSLPVLDDPALDPAAGTVALALGEHDVGLQLTAGGGILALRTLDNALELDGADKHVCADTVARELRITLGQLAPDTRSLIRRLRVFGSGPIADTLARELTPRAQQLGLAVERVAKPAARNYGISLPNTSALTPALALAARHLAGHKAFLDFLPPRVSAWQQLTARYSSRKLASTGAIAAVLALLAVTPLLFQHVELSRLRSQWSAMEPKVREVEQIQDQIRQFRPWFDDSLRTLTILKRLTEAFPEDGAVTAKSIEIRDAAPITCRGTARNNPDLMRVLDQLGQASEIADVNVENLSGKSPLQFSFNFQWQDPSAP